MKLLYIVVNVNGTQCFSKEKDIMCFSQNNVLTALCIEQKYRCIMIHQRQYIDTSTLCFVATLVYNVYCTYTCIYILKFPETLYTKHIAMYLLLRELWWYQVVLSPSLLLPLHEALSYLQYL